MYAADSYDSNARHDNLIIGSIASWLRRLYHAVKQADDDLFAMPNNDAYRLMPAREHNARLQVFSYTRRIAWLGGFA